MVQGLNLEAHHILVFLLIWPSGVYLLDKIYWVSKMYLLYRKMYLLCRKMYLLYRKIYLLYRKMYLLYRKMYLMYRKTLIFTAKYSD
jgi:hypothetical protein